VVQHPRWDERKRVSRVHDERRLLNKELEK
jgi:hypothetical protein